jgi:hypothetical protein
MLNTLQPSGPESRNGLSGKPGAIHDADARKRVQTFDWVGGGTSPPAIGPRGHVYAIASNILFVFPPPAHVIPPIPGVTDPARLHSRGQ